MNEESRNLQKQMQAGSLIKVMSFTAEKAAELSSANSVLGERIERDGVTIIPVSKISAGFAGGGADVADMAKRKKQNPAGAGAKVTVTPLTFLVIDHGNVKIINIEGTQNNGTSIAESIINSVMDKIKSKKEKKTNDKASEA